MPLIAGKLPFIDFFVPFMLLIVDGGVMAYYLLHISQGIPPRQTGERP
jgi:hypothetical protein